jgi:predicted tellurium resistance membrane protein TerC
MENPAKMTDHQPTIDQKPIKWWKDKKLLTGVILVLLSVILGFYGKGLFIIKFYEPVYLITGLSIWAFSWVLLFLGVFLVGWETVRMIQQRIHHHVKKTVRETYHYTKGLPRKGYHYTKKLHKRLTK